MHVSAAYDKRNTIYVFMWVTYIFILLALYAKTRKLRLITIGLNGLFSHVFLLLLFPLITASIRCL